jgi:hypothetical protein
MVLIESRRKLITMTFIKFVIELIRNLSGRRIILVLSACLISNITFGQESPTFNLTIDGVKPIVIQLDSMDAKSLYNKMLKWVQESYKNPNEVLKTNFENEK